jgi:hypothetical protein
MAQKTTVQLIDDIDGTEATETLSFALDGATYEIDVNEAHAAAMREAFAPYIGAGRRTGGRSQRGRTSTDATSDYDPKAVRAWAAANQVEIPARGRIPAAVLEQYRAAGN